MSTFASFLYLRESMKCRLPTTILVNLGKYRAGLSPKVMTEKKVAVIGSGLAGLTCAYLLSISGVHVSLYEKEGSIGMDSQSLSIACINNVQEKKSLRVETPMRSISAGFYTRVLRLYRYLKIPMVPRTFDYNFFDGETRETYTIYKGRGGIAGFTMDRSWLEMFAVIFGFIYFALLALILTTTGLTRTRWLREMSHADFCRYFWVARDFRYQYIDPMFMAVTTCSRSDLGKYPSAYILEYRAKTLFQSHYATDVQMLVRELASPIRKIYLSASTSIEENTKTVSCQGRSDRYDFIVLAYPPDEIPCTRTSVVTHRSDFCMPSSGARDLNLGVHESYTTASHVISREESLIQTTLPTAASHNLPECIAHAQFHRAKATVQTSKMLDKYLSTDGASLSKQHGLDGIYQCGSFVFHGIPLLEGCVTSAELVARNILERLGIDQQQIDQVFQG